MNRTDILDSKRRRILLSNNPSNFERPNKEVYTDTFDKKSEDKSSTENLKNNHKR